MSSTFPQNGEAAIAARFNFLLRGRKASPWGEWVGLSQGTISRLKKGALPNPEKLSVACRAENLSLTWLLEGIGAPYIVHSVASTEEGVAHVRMQIDDESSWRPLLVIAPAGRSIVLHQPGQADTDDGVCDYRIAVIIGGQYDALRVAALLGVDSDPILSAIEIENEAWHRLATGYMSATELFGWRSEPGLFETARHAGLYELAGRSVDAFRVREADAVYDEAATLLATLSAEERATVLRMLRGLSR